MSEERVPNAERLTVRWTIGDVRERGFEMLRLSIACAFRIFGPMSQYTVCVNSISVQEACAKTGTVPAPVEWREVTRKDLPDVLRAHFDESIIEGMGWKLIPLHTDPDRYELALDNDCILWDVPHGIRQWLRSSHGALFAEDVERCLGSFDAMCRPGCLNAGIRGLSPGAQLDAALETVLRQVSNHHGHRLQLVAEIEEQGLQAAAISQMDPLFLVTNREVSICSPFWPRSPELGTCGAHFVGMNARHIPWNYYDRPADLWLEEHWQRHRPALYEKAGLDPLSSF